MSTYYLFYIGYEDKGGMIHPYGPYNKFGNLTPVFERSRSFCNINNEFYNELTSDKMAEDFKEELAKLGYSEEDMKFMNFYYMNIKDMPSTNYQKSGYYKYEEIMDYFNDDMDTDYFTSSYSPDEFGLLLKKAVDNNDKEEIERLKEYTYITFPDTTCKEYDSFMIQSIIRFGEFDDFYIERAVKENVNKENNPDKTNQEYENTVIIMKIY